MIRYNTLVVARIARLAWTGEGLFIGDPVAVAGRMANKNENQEKSLSHTEKR